MSTANFRTIDHDIPLYVLDTSELDNEEIDFVGQNIFDELNHFNLDLDLFRVELRSGYYTGLQLFARIQFNGFDYSAEEIANFDDDDADYYTCCYTAEELMQLYEHERQLISQKFELLAADWGLLHLRCFDVFSNGSAVYEEVK